ncbi:hypothetical protein D3C87_1537310 [compost metagenome]
MKSSFLVADNIPDKEESKFWMYPFSFNNTKGFTLEPPYKPFGYLTGKAFGVVCSNQVNISAVLVREEFLSSMEPNKLSDIEKFLSKSMSVFDLKLYRL